MEPTRLLLCGRILKEIFTSKFSPQLLPIRCYRMRKPMWMGRAKTKMFKIPPRPVIPELDKLELSRLHDNYKTMFASIREYCRNEYYLKAQATGDIAMKRQQKDAEQLSLMLEENELENQRIAKSREEFVSSRMRDRDERLRTNILKQAEIDKVNAIRAEHLLKEKVVLAETFIGRDQLDAVIEHALANVTDYRFALSPDGKTLKQTETES